MKEGDELLITGETTGAYELVAQDLHDAKGNIQTTITKGHPFAIKTTKTIHRGDRLFLLQESL